MSAIQKVKKLGIIAGGGELPIAVAEACERQGIEVFIVSFQGQPISETQDLLVNYPSVLFHFGETGRIFKELRKRDIQDLTLIGWIRRPSFSEIKPDLKTMQFFAKAGFKALGDNSLLVLLREFLESENFQLHGAHDIVPDLLMPQGVLGKVKPSKEYMVDIMRGVEVSQTLGRLDVGQSVIVQEGMVLGVEGMEGTDGLIERCEIMQREGRSSVLVKTCKPQQDRDLDMPTIGLDTVRMAYSHGIGGIILHAGASILLNRDEVIEFADQHGIFVMGVDPND